jgi:hypothetical protein
MSLGNGKAHENRADFPKENQPYLKPSFDTKA